MGARDYDPRLGRFISPDTIIPDPTNPEAANRYSYGYNSPLTYVDPTGHDPESSTPEDRAEAQNTDPPPPTPETIVRDKKPPEPVCGNHCEEVSDTWGLDLTTAEQRPATGNEDPTFNADARRLSSETGSSQGATPCNAECQAARNHGPGLAGPLEMSTPESKVTDRSAYETALKRFHDARAEIANQEATIALYQQLIEGKLSRAEVAKHLVNYGNAYQGVTAEGLKQPPVVQEAIDCGSA